MFLAIALSLSTAQATDSRLVAYANEIDRSFESMGAILVDDLAVASLQTLARRLSPTTSRTIRLLRHPSANAFAMPNDDIYLHTGLLLRVVTETELAALLAHEIAHSELGHFDRPPESLNRLSNSRSIKDEAAADNTAIEMLSGAGYCPAAAAQFFRRLQQERADTRRDTDFAGSHPSLGERLARWAGSRCDRTSAANRVIQSFDVFRNARLDALTQLALQQRGGTLVYLSSVESVREALGHDGE
ncbi:MAG: M48 family metallopeptidase, partial [Pseudomonadota bacterium]